MAKGKRGTKKSKKDEVEAEKARLAAHGVQLSDEQAQAAVETGKVELEGNQDGPAIPDATGPDEANHQHPDSPTGEVGVTEQDDGSLVQADSQSEAADPEKQEGGDGAGDEEEKVVTSVVADKYKTNYIENAKAKGIAGKAAKRSNWDWLAELLAKHCLGEKEKIDIAKFTAILDENGVDYSKWTNRNKGWEGRFRMTGRVVLQKKVADAGFITIGGQKIEAPPAFIEQFKTKA